MHHKEIKAFHPSCQSQTKQKKARGGSKIFQGGSRGNGYINYIIYIAIIHIIILKEVNY